jgi:hypothetical protein
MGRDRPAPGDAGVVSSMTAHLRRALMVAVLVIGLGSIAPACANDSPAPLADRRVWTLEEGDLRPPAGVRLQLEMAFVAGANWQPDVILDAARQAAAILAQCHVAVTRVRVHEFDGPERYRYFRTDDAREFARRSELARPAIFFVDDTLQAPAFDAEAIGRANGKTRPELIDTVWITAAIRDLPIALAHELVHLLTDSGEHSLAPDNLMRDETAPGQTRLTAEQCDRVVSMGRAKGLLQDASEGR